MSLKANIIFLVLAALVILLVIAFHPPEQPAERTKRDAAIEAMSAMERNCFGMWLKYERTPISELTITQLRGIQTCEALGLYHDLKVK
jgi:hypothetical protein